jgi:hypothetical protein
MRIVAAVCKSSEKAVQQQQQLLLLLHSHGCLPVLQGAKQGPCSFINAFMIRLLKIMNYAVLLSRATWDMACTCCCSCWRAIFF